MSAQSLSALNAGAAAIGEFDFKKAKAAFDLAVAEDPRNPYARLGSAIAELNMSEDGAQQRAIELFKPLVDDQFVGLRARYCTAMGWIFLGEPARATEHLKSVVALSPRNSFARYYLGQCLELSGDMAGAQVEYQEATALNPYLRSSLLGLQRIAEREGQTEDAAKFLAEFDAMSNNPRSSLAQFKYTRMGPLAEVLLPVSPSAPSQRPTINIQSCQPRCAPLGWYCCWHR